MSERDAIERAIELIGNGFPGSAYDILRAALRRHDERNAQRRERDRLIEDYCVRYGLTAREARSLLVVERPDLRWQQR